MKTTGVEIEAERAKFKVHYGSRLLYDMLPNAEYRDYFTECLWTGWLACAQSRIESDRQKDMVIVAALGEGLARKIINPESIEENHNDR